MADRTYHEGADLDELPDFQLADPITDARDWLIATIQRCALVKDREVLGYFTQRELADARRKLDPPSVGVLYAGYLGSADGTDTGLVGRALFDVFLVGGDRCRANINGAPADALAVLAVLRAHVFGECAAIPHGRRAYRLDSETPAELAGQVCYRQRWSTVIANPRRTPSRHLREDARTVVRCASR